MINEEVRLLLEPELSDNEELLWADKPAKRPYPWRGVCRAGFWCIWMMFCCIFVIGALTQSARNPHLPVRLIFSCIGIVFLSVGYTMRKTYLKAFLGPKFEVYGLTNKRAIILSPLWKDHQFINWRGQDHSKNFIMGDDLTPVKFVPSANTEIGTIIFSGWWDKIRFKWHIHPNPDSPKILSNLNGFRNVKNAATVARLIEDTFGAPQIVAGIEHPVEEKRVEVIRQMRTKRILLWSIFPLFWLVLTFSIGVSNWLFLSFITFPFFIASAFYAVREIIRPNHSYRISS